MFFREKVDLAPLLFCRFLFPNRVKMHSEEHCLSQACQFWGQICFVFQSLAPPRIRHRCFQLSEQSLSEAQISSEFDGKNERSFVS